MNIFEVENSMSLKSHKSGDIDMSPNIGRPIFGGVSNLIDHPDDASKTDSLDNAMYVIKRDGSREEVSFGKCQNRISNMRTVVEPRLNYVNVAELTQQVVVQMSNNISTREIDELTANCAAQKETIHPDYGKLASRIIISNHHKNTSPSFSEVVQQLWDNRDKHDKHSPIVAKYFYDVVMANKEKLNSVINYKNDFNYTYFGYKTLERAYLMRINGRIVERPQHMLMRVAVALHRDDMREAVKTYKIMSEGYFTPATPTLFNMGTNREQGSSCFLLTMNDDSITGIFKTISDCAEISKWAGGIGVSIHNIRGKNSDIRGTNGKSNGLLPMLKVFNETARYVDQCVTPNTIIYTTKGPIKMEDVVVGETEVYNLNGEAEVVENVLEHPYDGKMISITSMHGLKNLNITPEHPVYCLQGQEKEASYDMIKNRLRKGLIKPDWVDAGELIKDDMLVYPIPTYSKDIDNISEDDCYVYGVILGGGYIPINKSYSYVTIENSKSHILTKLHEYFKSKFIKSVIGTNNDTNESRIHWDKCTSLPFKYSDFYHNKEKRCHSRWLNLPLDKAKYILKGLIDICGTIGEEIVFKNRSNYLIEAVRFICLRMGILTIGFMEDRLDWECINERERTCCLKIPKNDEVCVLFEIKNEVDKFERFLRYDNLLFSRIKNIDETEYSGTLYDLQMKNEHNYLLHQGLVHNGGGKRKGSFAMYIEPWHCDIEDFLMMKRNTGADTDRARDLFYALWVPDLFMERVEADEDWALMCPDECPGLYDKHGKEFNELYTKYEKEGKYRELVKARDLWNIILDSQIETGTPYICYKDAVNRKSNQSNLGTIRSSNLCTEIVEFTSKEEVAVCNLSSIALPKFVEYEKDEQTGQEKVVFNYKKLEEITKNVAKNLNKLIDWNFYPIPEAELSNRRHRPIGIGVQGLADTFALMRVPFDSKEASEINERIFAHIYIASIEASMEIARKRKKYIQEYKRLVKEEEKDASALSKEDIIRITELREQHFIIEEELKLPSQYAGAYSSFMGSPIHQGQLQYDLWEQQPLEDLRERFGKLKEDIKKHGVRNSLMIAPMPTASTSQILGNNECIEPYTSNIYKRRTLAGEFKLINQHLLKDLIELGLWNQNVKDQIIVDNGSIQNIPQIPDNIKALYKIVWEMSQKTIINMAADRGKYICQTQSMNLFVAQPTHKKLTAMHFHAWKKGLKTGIYYLRTLGAAQAQKFSVDASKIKSGMLNNGSPTDGPILACSRDNPDCEACSA